MTRKKYPTAEAFAKDIPRILRDLGFSPARAKYLAEHIAVDPSRGAGHAMGAERRGDKAHLRTRVEPDGMDYKGYNIAVHELGHNVEQTFSLYDIDYTLLAGVPNTAFTEALAFLFQARDLELLGRPRAQRRSRAAARARHVLEHARDRGLGARRDRRLALALRAPERDRRPAARGDGQDRAGHVEQVLRAVARRQGHRAARHLQPHDHVAAVPVQLRARSPDRVPGRGARRGQGQGDVREGVRARRAARLDPARRVDDPGDGQAGDNAAAARCDGAR